MLGFIHVQIISTKSAFTVYGHAIGVMKCTETFDRRMDRLFRGLKWNICLWYLDVVALGALMSLFFHSRFSEHLLRLRKALSCY